MYVLHARLDNDGKDDCRLLESNPHRQKYFRQGRLFRLHLAASLVLSSQLNFNEKTLPCQSCQQAVLRRKEKEKAYGYSTVEQPITLSSCKKQACLVKNIAEKRCNQAQVITDPDEPCSWSRKDSTLLGDMCTRCNPPVLATLAGIHHILATFSSLPLALASAGQSDACTSYVVVTW